MENPFRRLTPLIKETDKAKADEISAHFDEHLSQVLEEDNKNRSAIFAAQAQSDADELRRLRDHTATLKKDIQNENKEHEKKVREEEFLRLTPAQQLLRLYEERVRERKARDW